MLRPRIYAALLIALPAWLLTPLQQQIEHERRQLQYGGAAISRPIRDQIGQGFSIALLAGFRGVVADFIWIQAQTHWENRAWLQQSECIENAVQLQPRSTYFWDSGAWHMGWNIAHAERIGTNEVPLALAINRERYWHQRAQELLERGIQNIPNRYDLHFKLGFLYEQKLVHDCGGDSACEKARYAAAAKLLSAAAEFPDAPTHIARKAARCLEQSGALPAAYQFWVEKIWRNERQISFHQDRRIAAREIRRLEERLDIAPASRLFPKPPTPQ